MTDSAVTNPAVEQLIARSHSLGADPRTTNYGGGNTSAKGTATDPATGAALTTTLWGYGSKSQAPSYPGRTFNVRRGIPITVRYVNELMNSAGPLPHRLPVDTTLDWANPGNLGGRAPVPLVAHRHGGDQGTLSDGLPDAWSTPDVNKDGMPDYRGRLYSATYTFDNGQEAGHLWYHDHALGVTRLNVYMGLAGNYFIRDLNEDFLVASGQLPGYPYELPICIQDRQFSATGGLNYPATDPANPQAPNPTHLPEFFGDVIVANGVPWPLFNCERRMYRLRLLNGSDSRVYTLGFALEKSLATRLTFWQIGTDLGLMNSPVALTSLLTAAALAPLALPGSDTWLVLAVQLALLSGLLQLAFGVLRLAHFADLLSHPVLHGFINACSVLICLAQLPALLGINGAGQLPFAEGLAHLAGSLPDAHLPSLALGTAAIVLLMLLNRLAPRWPGMLLVIAGLGTAAWFGGFEASGGKVVGALPEQVIALALPATDWRQITDLLPAAFVLALVSFLEAMSSCKVAAARTGQRWDGNQELIGQGLAKLTAAVCQAYPVSGSFGRSAFLLAAGARTGLASVVGALVVLGALLLAMLPILILYLFLQRYIVEGVTSGAVKG